MPPLASWLLIAAGLVFVGWCVFGILCEDDPFDEVRDE